jgi:hypothetical protein
MPKTVKIASVTELEPGTAKTIVVEDKTLALFNVDGRSTRRTTPARMLADRSAKGR